MADLKRADSMSETFALDHLAGDAGMFDIGARRYGHGHVPLDVARSRADSLEAASGIGRMANPERFGDALERMPLSDAPAEYEPSFYADKRGRF